MNIQIYHTVHRLLLSASLVMTLAACQTDNEEQSQPSPATDTAHYVLRLDGSFTSFDGTATRAVADWEDGTRLCLQFHQDKSLVAGIAEYSQADGLWTVTAAGNLIAAEDAACEVYYFESSEIQTSKPVLIGAASYADRQASFTVNVETHELIVKAHLSPLTARLRLTGQAGREYAVKGLKWLTSYDPATNSLTESVDKLSGALDADGSSEFIYALFADLAERTLIVDNTATTSFRASFPDDVLVAGTSGRIALPSDGDADGWRLTDLDGHELTLPELSDVSAINITFRSASLVAAVISDGHGTLTDAGFVYSKTSNAPLLSDTKISCGAKIALASGLMDLEAETTYYVRAYAINEKGTAYSTVLTFTTKAKPADTDIDLDDYGKDVEWGASYATQGISMDDYDSDKEWGTGYSADGIIADDYSDDDEWAVKKENNEG